MKKPIETSLHGHQLLENSYLNKGTSFTLEERISFGLQGLLPPRVATLEEQITRIHEHFSQKKTSLEKYVQLRALQERNEVLFFAFLSRHLEEVIPIIYTPTVGEAVQLHSHIYRSPRGLYISPENIGYMEEMAENLPSRNIELIVATDNQGILGIGDQGIGGMEIPIGKLSLYTLAAGIDPAACLPISLDVGTDNQTLLEDPLYLGMKHKRLTGKEYADFIETFVVKIKKLYPQVLVQWEDLSKQNAFYILNRYRDNLLSFNDDIQGTGAVAVAGLLNAVKIKNEKITDQIFCIYGAGAGGIGVAGQIYNTLLREGLNPEEAHQRIFVLDSKGLITTTQKNLEDYKRPFAANFSERYTLLEVIQKMRVTVLLGLSGATSSFTKPMVEALLQNTPKPIIFPLSNPTSKAEASPKDLIAWSRGQAIVATGSPFAPVSYEGKTYTIGQGNNAFIFPGVGLGVLAAKAKKVTDTMFAAAADALSKQVSGAELEQGHIFPPIQKIRSVSVQVATAVFEEVLHEGLAPTPKQTPLNIIKDKMWEPVYLPFKKIS
ncbi:MAG: NAD-dependent malic enzyme [Deltaproteobacteria bacterium]|nr:NAD-dependent malic enzyme [Deltaproteobacteria bacterium]